MGVAQYPLQNRFSSREIRSAEFGNGQPPPGARAGGAFRVVRDAYRTFISTIAACLSATGLNTWHLSESTDLTLTDPLSRLAGKADCGP